MTEWVGDALIPLVSLWRDLGGSGDGAVRVGSQDTHTPTIGSSYTYNERQRW